MIADLDEEHIDIVLSTHHVGHLGCHANGRTYVVPVTYAFDHDRIVGHTNSGMKMDILRQNPSVCFQVDDIQDMQHWRSVIAWGDFEELEGRDAAKALDLLFARLATESDNETTIPKDAPTVDIVGQKIKLRPTKGVIYQIRLREKTGRFEQP